MKVGENLRRSLRLTLASDIPAQHIDEVVDIACHAAEYAINECIRIALHTHPDSRIGIAAAGPAFGMLVTFAQTALDGVKDFGKTSGMKVTEARIGGAA